MSGDGGEPFEAPLERIGRHVIELLEAAHEHGDREFLALVEIAAFRAGRMIAASMLLSDDDDDGQMDGVDGKA